MLIITYQFTLYVAISGISDISWTGVLCYVSLGAFNEIVLINSISFIMKGWR